MGGPIWQSSWPRGPGSMQPLLGHNQMMISVGIRFA